MTKSVILDKTGTITEGHPSVTDIISSNELETLEIAASLEAGSEHPLAETIRSKAENMEISVKSVSGFRAIPGRGIEGFIDGERCVGGNLSFMKEEKIELPGVETILEQLANAGKTPMIFAKNGKYVGIIAVADTIKATSAAAIKRMRDMGLTVTMLTGDNRLTAEAIAAQAGIDEVVAEVLPGDKEKVVSERQKNGEMHNIVTFVGDGINDSPALTRADVGIAIGSGADIAIDSADIVLMKSDLNDVAEAIDFSHKTIRNIKQNLFWAFFYNSLGIPVAMGVLVPFGITLSPMIGAAAMSLSSLFVVTNALRLQRK